VGAFGPAMEQLHKKNYFDSLKVYLTSGRPFMGICVGMQSLFESSDEAPGVKGLGIIPAKVVKFNSKTKTVPHMGWNGAIERTSFMSSNQITNGMESQGVQLSKSHYLDSSQLYYFVHSYAVLASSPGVLDWIHSCTRYNDEVFVSSICKGNIFATQFHPEKSGPAGLKVLKAFLTSNPNTILQQTQFQSTIQQIEDFTLVPDLFSKRIVACLDVRTNDQGDLVVTKGDQYDVREKGNGHVRNLGRPVDLARRYFEEGADEITFLNITSFRELPLKDIPMLDVLKKASENIFVPLTLGGGIRDMTDPDGTFHSALEVVGEYFRSEADKVSIGSDAVYAAEQYWRNDGKCTKSTSIEQISEKYGSQAVVISVDPRRIYVKSPNEAPTHHVIKTQYPGPNQEEYCWYQCTVKGGREGRDLDVYQLVVACEALGAGEVLLNCMDKDGTNSGYDLELILDVKKSIRIPVIASSGAGNVDHFTQVFQKTGVEAALAAGIFHRSEVTISAVKDRLKQDGFRIRLI